MLFTILCLTIFTSCKEKGFADKQKSESNKLSNPMLPSCDTLEYYGRDWDYADKTSIFLSVFCFPIEPNDSTALLGWDPKSYRVTKMDREFVFPDQTGNAGKVLMTDGTNVYWGDLPTP